MAAYGDGRIFRRGPRWWIAYSAIAPSGLAREVRESAGRTEQGAQKLLRQRLREAANQRDGIGSFVAPRHRRATVEQLLERYIEDCETRRIRSARTTRCHTRPLGAVLGGHRASTLGLREIQGYVAVRRGAGMRDATIDRELEVLRAAFRLAKAEKRVPDVPVIRQLLPRHANARRGFVSPGNFQRLLAAIEDPDLVDFLEWFWWTAQRPGEIASLTWASLDETAGVLHLEARDAKVKRARVVPIVGPLETVIARRRARRLPGMPFIFHAGRRACTRSTGGLIDRWMDAWHRALAQAGLEPSLIPYDLRRSAIRNLRLAGVPERTIMEISGHLTRETFDRYAIVTTDDMAAAFRAAAAAQQTDNPDKTRTLRWVRGGQDVGQ